MSVSYHPVTLIPKFYSFETAILVGRDDFEGQGTKYIYI
jgi:hypothetical protein